MERSAPPDYEVIEHTADIGVQLWAASREELFETAAAAFMDVMIGVENIRLVERSTLAAESIDVPGLLVALLSELLYVFEVERRIFGRVKIIRMDEETLQAEAWGEAFDPERHDVKEPIKAVTYHRLKVEEREGRWMARVIFDL